MPGKTREARLAADRRWYSKASTEIRQRRWRRLQYKRYGLTTEQYDELHAGQGGLCAICQRSGGKRRLDVDHDHHTGKVRGLLCGGCNKYLGQIGDNPTVLEAALQYLKDSNV